MKPYNFKWIVKIPAGCFMAGIHRFKTKKAGQEFIDKWNRTPGNHSLTFSQLPKPFKAWKTAESI